jgi:hypothetical protein
MTTANRMGRNPFAPKASPSKSAPARETASRSSSQQRKASEDSGIIQKLVIEFPIHIVFMGLKSWVLFREVVRTATQRA